MTDLVLVVIIGAFLVFGGVLSSVSIYVALADRADYRRRHREFLRLKAQAEERYEHRSHAGQIHASMA